MKKYIILFELNKKNNRIKNIHKQEVKESFNNQIEACRKILEDQGKDSHITYDFQFTVKSKLNKYTFYTCKTSNSFFHFNIRLIKYLIIFKCLKMIL